METKKKYISPTIELIVLDNDISLALASSPPPFPGEGVLLTPDTYKNNPYNNCSLV